MKNKPLSSTHVQEITSPAPRHRPDQAGEPKSAGGGFVTTWTNFWFTACDPIAFHALRVAAGLLFLFWLLPFAGHVEEFFSLSGWCDREMFVEMSRLPLEQRPPLGWSLLYVFGSPAMAQVLYWFTIGVLVLFTLGLATRATSILSWVLIVSYVSFLSAPIGHTEDDLLIVPALYLMIGYVLYGQFSQRLSPPEKLLGSWDAFLLAGLFRKQPSGQPSYAANLAVRLFQVHFCVILVASCLHKLQFGDWWSGVGFWYPLHPPFETTRVTIQGEAPHALTLLFLHSLVQYIVLAWQLTFPLWAWRPRFRMLLLGGGLVAAIGGFWVYRTPVAGPFYLVGCLAFISSAEWRRLGASLAGLVRKKSMSEATAGAKEKPTPVTV